MMITSQMSSETNTLAILGYTRYKSNYGLAICGESFRREKDTIISVTYGTTDSTLNVPGSDVYLDSDGYYRANHYRLRLWNDSIFSHFMNGSIGCGIVEVYDGYRISRNP
jgi:hypothetical protein